MTWLLRTVIPKLTLTVWSSFCVASKIAIFRKVIQSVFISITFLLQFCFIPFSLTAWATNVGQFPKLLLYYKCLLILCDTHCLSTLLSMAFILTCRKWSTTALDFFTFSFYSLQFSSLQSLSHVQLFATPWTAACQASLSITNSWSSLRLTSIKSVMPSSHLIFCHPLFLLPPVPPNVKVFSNESTLCMRWPKVLEFQL